MSLIAAGFIQSANVLDDGIGDLRANLDRDAEIRDELVREVFDATIIYLYLGFVEQGDELVAQGSQLSPRVAELKVGSTQAGAWLHGSGSRLLIESVDRHDVGVVDDAAHERTRSLVEQDEALAVLPHFGEHRVDVLDRLDP